MKSAIAARGQLRRHGGLRGSPRESDGVALHSSANQNGPTAASGGALLPSTERSTGDTGGQHDLLLACFAAGSGLRVVCIVGSVCRLVGLAQRLVGSGIRAASSSINDLPKRSITRSALWREPIFQRTTLTELNAALDVE